MTTTTSPARFTRSQRAAIIVCAPVRLGPGALAHKPAHHNVSAGGKAAPGTLVGVTVPGCQPTPEPDDPHAGRGWAQYTAGWADHMGALACPDCYPPEQTH